MKSKRKVHMVTRKKWLVTSIRMYQLTECGMTVNPEPGASRIETSTYWDDVTCKRCLKKLED